MAADHYLGIDVGTGSARAGIYDAAGRARGVGVHPIQIFRPAEDHIEQSSDDIWRACGLAVRAALAAAGLPAQAIAGIGFDATCSLVLLDDADRPVTASLTGNEAQNVIVWMDHRALEQAARINRTGHRVLRYVGGAISPEMQTPKLLWLAEHLPTSWQRTARFLDLPDFLTYRATGIDVRSLCSATCKWTYLAHEEAEHGSGWAADYFAQIGLGDLAAEGFARIGTRVRPMGERIGGLTPAAAADLGLTAGTAVAVSIIDAHAGGLGMLGAVVDGVAPDGAALEQRLALIGGTSSCHMAVSRQPRYPGGIWGPYFSAMIPGLWLTEGGQSATGALIDHIIGSHARAAELGAAAKAAGTTVYALLNERLASLAEAAGVPTAHLTRRLHVMPDFHGNRSPRADPELRGMISGLKLGDSVEALALLYLATVQALAHGTRHIIDTMNQAGFRIDTLLACGGDTRNELFVREHADVTGCRILLPEEPEAVLLGAAVLGAVAAGRHPSVLAAMAAMNRVAREVRPAGAEIGDYHQRKHLVFQRMAADQIAYSALMGSGPGAARRVD
jgi:FGGY-family pentulose kinase